VLLLITGEIREVAGAIAIGVTPLSPAAHQIETHRMGVDPKD
jgi:hypothetical protein